MQRHRDVARTIPIQLAIMSDEEKPQDSETEPRDGPGHHASSKRKAQVRTDQGGAESEFECGTPFGNYKLLRRIGAGGMGQVWKAEEDYPRRIVALKLVKPQLFTHRSDEERARTVRRFRTEIETAAKLEHPNIVPLYHAGEEDGRLYYTMQYVEGRSPLHVLRSYQPTVAREDTPDNQSDTSRDGANIHAAASSRSEPRACLVPADSDRAQWLKAAKYIAEASRGLAYAHNRGFIHRDIKPDNIIVDQATDTARVTDFGLAKALQESTDMEIPADYRAGTRGFMAPEQEFKAGSATVQSDIYGLGATLLTLLSEAPPKKSAEESDRFDDVCSAHKTSIHPDLQAICLKCLQKKPDRRYSSASELADDLQRFLEVRPVAARPVSRVERLQYWVRRRPSLATVGLVAVILGVAVIIGGPVGAFLYMSAVHTAEIERQNKTIEAMEKRRAQDESRRTKANLYSQRAQTARERGDWRAVIKHLQDAETSGHSDPIMLAIERARARRSLGEIPMWIEAVRQLAGQADLEDHRGTVLLMRGDVARFQGQSEVSIELTKQALAAGLSPIDELYAHAILAQTTPECLASLREAVSRDPYHYDANMMLVAALVLSGYRDEARQRAQLAENLFPNDAGFAIWLAVLAAAESNPEEMKLQMERVGDRLDKETKELIFQALKNLQAFCDNFNHLDLARYTDLRMMWNLVSLALTVRKVHSKAGQRDSSLITATSSLPQAYRQAYAPLFELSPTNVMALISKGSSAYIERLEEAAKRHPEGTLHLMRGSLLANANRYAEAEEALAKAADAPAIIPGVNREAPMLAAAATNLLYWESGQDPACLERAVEYVRRRVRLGPSPAFQSDMLLYIAYTAGDDGLAQTIIWQVLDHYDEDVQWLLTVSENQLRANRPGSALATLNQVLAVELDNAKAESLRAQIMQEK